MVALQIFCRRRKIKTIIFKFFTEKRQPMKENSHSVKSLSGTTTIFPYYHTRITFLTKDYWKLRRPIHEGMVCKVVFLVLLVWFDFGGEHSLNAL